MTGAGLALVMAALAQSAPVEAPAPTPRLVYSVLELDRYALEHAAIQEAEGAGAVWVKLPYQGAPPPSPLFRASGKALYFAFGADYASTEAGLRVGLREGNPAQGNAAVRALTHIGVPIGLNYVTERLRRGGHDRVALVVRIAVTAFASYAAVNNVRKIQGRAP